jgi:glycosyltransferase involved in cell wall biosynthesis
MRLVAAVNHAPPFSFQWLAARLESLTLPRAGGVVCISKHTLEAVRGLAAKTWVVENAVEPVFFDIPRAPLTPKRLICAASVSLLKNQNALIRALDGLASKLPVELVFLGDPDIRESYGREFLELIRTRHWCVHAGFVGRAELRQHLAGASALVLPSLEENCPMVLLEAMAAGVPVAASNAGGIPDLVETGVTGILFDPRDAAGMSAAVEKLLGDGDFAGGLAERAKKMALTRFHPRRIAQRHVEIYREAAGIAWL